MSLRLAQRSLRSTFYCFTLLISNFSNAEGPPWIGSAKYEDGIFGSYPVQRFESDDVYCPRPNLKVQSDKCANDLLTFFSPRGYVDPARHAQATILDQQGRLVWTAGWGDDQIYNFQVQTYKNSPALTFWAGNDAVGGHGAGKYYIFDQQYELVKEITGAGKLEGDLHDFTLYPDGTATFTAYDIRDVDLSTLGKTVGPIWDCLIQEIDVESGNSTFQWRASDHVAVDEGFRPIGGEGDPNGVAFDWFHINSIERDPKGNYLISSRYTFSLFYIDKDTGKVLWRLGGKKNDFKDLSDGKATDFKFQHHARWSNNYTEVTIFDNNSDNSWDSKPRGVRVRLDQVAMTAELVVEYRNEEPIPSQSQGSFQDLPNGNVLLGYGYSGAYTEFANDGTVLCDTHIGPQSNYGSGDVQSYRVLKFDWHGYPNTKPATALKQDEAGVWRLWVSWNGATEVTTWVLQGSATEEAKKEDWQTIETVIKNGFESAFTMRKDHPRYLRIKALDSDYQVLSTSDPIKAINATVDYDSPDPPVNNKVVQAMDEQYDATDYVLVHDKWLWIAVAISIVGGVVLGLLAPSTGARIAAWHKDRKAGTYQQISVEDGGESAKRFHPS